MPGCEPSERISTSRGLVAQGDQLGRLGGIWVPTRVPTQSNSRPAMDCDDTKGKPVDARDGGLYG